MFNRGHQSIILNGHTLQKQNWQQLECLQKQLVFVLRGEIAKCLLPNSP